MPLVCRDKQCKSACFILIILGSSIRQVPTLNFYFSWMHLFFSFRVHILISSQKLFLCKILQRNFPMLPFLSSTALVLDFQVNHYRMIEWFGLEDMLKVTQSNPPATSRVNQIRLLKAQPKLTLAVSRDGASTTSLDNQF